MERGADREKLVLHLYKTQPLHALRLWGRVMSGLRWNEELRLAYASVPLEDFVETRSTPDDLPGILEKIRSNFSSGTVFLVFFPESVDTFRAYIKTSHGESLQTIGTHFQSTTFLGDTLSFTIAAASADECERIILEKLQSQKI
jgi:hypothetical protein